MSKTLCSSGVVAVVCVAFAGGYTRASQEPNEAEGALKRQIGEFEVKDEIFVQGLINLAGRCRFPLAIEWIQESKVQKLTRSWRDAKTSAILDDLVKSEPEYSWKLSRGVVHIYRRKLLGDKRNFLNLRLERFARQATFQQVNIGLFEEVRKTVRPPEGLMVMGRAGSGPSYAGDPLFDFSIEHITVREALDKLVLQNPKSKIWFVTYPETGILTATGFLEVAQIPRVLPGHQPFWNLLSWGDSAYWLTSPPR